MKHAYQDNKIAELHMQKIDKGVKMKYCKCGSVRKARFRLLLIVHLLIVHASKWQGRFLKQNVFQDCLATCCLAYRVL